GADIPAATASSYTRLAAQPADAGGYSVVVTNSAGAVTSILAALTVNIPPSISGQPQNQTVTQAQDATFTVTAGGTQPLNYQWRFSGANISGATASSYTRSAAQPGDAGSYTVLVTNVGGAITSAVATLIVNVRPFIFGQ